ncbi:MAG: hypothetical protein ABJO67_13295 [Pseudoruegeria sp.]
MTDNINVTVKPLVWALIDQVTYGAISCLGQPYTAWAIDGFGYCKFPGTSCGERFNGGLQEAKSAAQAHNDKLILSALKPSATAQEIAEYIKAKHAKREGQTDG